MQDTSLKSSDYSSAENLRHSFEWIIDESVMLEQFINTIQGKNIEFNLQTNKHEWVENKGMVKLVNEKGANFIRIYLETLLTKGAKTTVLSDGDINYECLLSSKDMLATLIHEAKNFEIDNIYIRPLKNMIVRFALVSLKKSSKDGRFLRVIEATTQQKIMQTNIQKEPEAEKKGLPILGRIFK